VPPRLDNAVADIQEHSFYSTFTIALVIFLTILEIVFCLILSDNLVVMVLEILVKYKNNIKQWSSLHVLKYLIDQSEERILLIDQSKNDLKSFVALGRS